MDAKLPSSSEKSQKPKKKVIVAAGVEEMCESFGTLISTSHSYIEHKGAYIYSCRIRL